MALNKAIVKEMDNFELHLPTMMTYGKDAHKNVGELLKPLATKVLIHYGSDRIKSSGLFDDIAASLNAAGISYVELGGVAPNPRVSLIKKGIEICRRENVDLILAVGGGSTIDSAKGIAVGIYYDGDDVWDMFFNKIPVDNSLPVAVILTIPAAGSEQSAGAVISNDELKIKTGYGSPMMAPKVGIVNPELFFSLPKNQIANGIADMISHIFERYFTPTQHTELTDALCEATLRTIMHNGPIVLDDPRNYDAWFEIAFAGSIAHNNLLGVGRVQDWAYHDMEHELSAIYDIAHGAGLAILTPNWMTYVCKTDISLFAQFAVNVMGVPGIFRDPEETALAGVKKLRTFFNTMGLPATLSDVGIDAGELDVMAKKATGIAFDMPHEIGGIKELGWEDVVNIYKLSL
jgi:alcohol dehydrogenase YqhD (iron-dependent ADH family)